MTGDVAGSSELAANLAANLATYGTILKWVGIVVGSVVLTYVGVLTIGSTQSAGTGAQRRRRAALLAFVVGGGFLALVGLLSNAESITRATTDVMAAVPTGGSFLAGLSVILVPMAVVGIWAVRVDRAQQAAHSKGETP